MRIDVGSKKVISFEIFFETFIELFLFIYLQFRLIITKFYDYLLKRRLIYEKLLIKVTNNAEKIKRNSG